MVTSTDNTFVETVKFSKIRTVNSPERAHDTDAGVDFYIPDNWNDGNPMNLSLGDSVLIPMGIKLNLGKSNMMKFENKSGIAAKRGLIMGASIIDAPYQGELHLNLIKATHGIVEIKPGMKIAQGIFYKINYFGMKECDDEILHTTVTDRGIGGFGSTGI